MRSRYENNYLVKIATLENINVNVYFKTPVERGSKVNATLPLHFHGKPSYGCHAQKLISPNESKGGPKRETY